MARQVRTHHLIRTQGIVLLVALVAVLALTGCSRFSLGDLRAGVIQPSIVPAVGGQGTRSVNRDFAFEDTRVRLRVGVDSAIYAGAVSAQKEAVFFGKEQPADWLSGYYRAFIAEKHQDEFYVSLVDALHESREKQRLDSSRYVELVTSMVQQLEYRTDPVNLAPKFPVETFGDGYGDCDDKTLLAAGILARDGYDVAVLFFGPEKHVALGIKAPGLDYKGTGYGYVEMTESSLVGIPPENIGDGAKLESDPTVITIGEGTEVYATGGQIAYIQGRLRALKSVRTRLGKQIESYTEEASRQRRDLESLKQELQVGGATEASVRQFNDRVNVFNELVATSNDAANRFNALIEVEKFVAAHQHARPQVYRELRAAKF